MERLGVTQTQVDMAVYSGYIPKPQEWAFGSLVWSARKIEPFLKNWEASLKRRKGKMEMNEQP